MPDQRTDDPSAVRLAEARAQLAQAQSAADALVALSGADLVTLRAIEADYFHHPGPASALRERISRAHADYVREWRQQMMSTHWVTPAVVAQWAAGTLAEWLRGYTDFEVSLGGQYRIAVLDSTADTVTVAVETAQGFDARRFRIAVSAEEVPA